MGKFVTTNVRLTEEIMIDLKLKCIYEKKRMAEIIREALENYIGKRVNLDQRIPLEKDPIIDIIGMCKTGIKDCSINHDKYLYKKQ